MKDVCKKFQVEHNIAVKVYERGGLKIGNVVKSDPLCPSTCEREDCFPCTSGGKGDCSKSCSSYRMECEECETFGKALVCQYLPYSLPYPLIISLLFISTVLKYLPPFLLVR